ncbi:MAG: hypothetical protein D6728_02530 [Cyanobacteria bacterium J055]|nr:MAG: hypothetical protein D6728_02530 [Cyanobacteria bacterium J055]
MLRQLDLCSRMGTGFPLAGLQLMGFTRCGLAEIDRYCSHILRQRFPEVRNYGNLRELSERETLEITDDLDLISAAPPSQPFLKLRGISHPRDCLFDILKIVGRLQPKFFVLNTVPELLKCPYAVRAKTAYAYYLFREIDRLGYDAEWLVISSGELGSPFCRERLLLVGYSREFFDPKFPPRNWMEQYRNELETIGSSERRGVSQSNPAGGLLQFARRVDRSVGVSSGDRTYRYSKKVVKNILDPRVAAVALRRVLYLNSLVER